MQKSNAIDVQLFTKAEKHVNQPQGPGTAWTAARSQRSPCLILHFNEYADEGSEGSLPVVCRKTGRSIQIQKSRNGMPELYMWDRIGSPLQESADQGENHSFDAERTEESE